LLIVIVSSPSSSRHFSPRQPPAASPGRNQISPLNRPPPPPLNFLRTRSLSRAATPANLALAFAISRTSAGFDPSQLQNLINTQSTHVGTPNSFQNFPTQNGLQNHPPPSRPGSATASTMQNSPLIPDMGMPMTETLLQGVGMSRPVTPLQQMESSISQFQQPQGYMTPSRRETEFRKLKEEFDTCSAQEKQHVQTLTSPQRCRYLQQRRMNRMNMSDGLQKPNFGQEAQTAQQPPPSNNQQNQDGQRLYQAPQLQQHGINAQQALKISPFGHFLLHASPQQNSQQVQQQPHFSNNTQLQNMCTQSQMQVAQTRPTIAPTGRQGNNTSPEPVQLQSNEAADARLKATAKISHKLQTTGSTIPAATPTPSPPNAAASSHTTSAPITSLSTFVPRRVVCLRCTENWWDKSCDSGEPCSNCEADTISKRECVRPKCEKFATGTCDKRAACKRAHEDDGYDHVEKYKKTLKRTGRMRDSAVAPSLRAGSSQNSQESLTH
jgi:hypothetical protein